MKRCPTCNKTFSDRSLSFCIDDGTPLAPVDDPEDEVTVVAPSGNAANRSVGPSGTADEETLPPYQPPGSYSSPGTAAPKRRAWPWILGLLLLLVLVIAGMGTMAWFYLKPLKHVTPNTNSSNANGNTNRTANVNRAGNWNSNNSNTNSTNGNLNLSNSPNANQNGNDNTTGSETTPAPTDEVAVLAGLTDLENEWTVANINADRKKLNQILADDYAGTSSDGRTQGKATYLRDLERDTTIQKWEFTDLKVSLKGDRSTLTGVVHFTIENEDRPFGFIDKFVWRDGRWQATSSQVSTLK